MLAVVWGGEIVVAGQWVQGVAFGIWLVFHGVMCACVMSRGWGRCVPRAGEAWTAPGVCMDRGGGTLRERFFKIRCLVVADYLLYLCVMDERIV